MLGYSRNRTSRRYARWAMIGFAGLISVWPLTSPVDAAKAKVPLPRARPASAPALKTADVPLPTPAPAAAERPAPMPMRVAMVSSSSAKVPAVSAADITALKQAIKQIDADRPSSATDIQRSISDPLARKLAEYLILRGGNVPFGRYVAFISANPDWPSTGLFRSRAEAALWEDRIGVSTVRTFFAKEKPTTAKGKLALARALLAQGDRVGAQYYVRDVWRSERFSEAVERQVLSEFSALLTATDHKFRMEDHLYAEDSAGALRAAARAGGASPAIAKAWIAVNKRAKNAGALLDAVPQQARRDPGYIFCRIQWLRRANKISDAARLMLAAPRDPTAIHDSNEWWIERRLVARELLDIGDPRAAYRVARDAVRPTKENYRAESQFTAGWIALRFLNDPNTAYAHFARVDEGIANPIARARAGYWRGRAAEAAGRNGEARSHYQAAARYSTAYYGQLARARLGLTTLGLNPPPAPNPSRRSAIARSEVVRALDLIYQVGKEHLAVPMLIDLGNDHPDIDTLSVLGQVAAKHKDARGMLYLGKTALARGLPFEHYAFPTVGIPNYRPIGPKIHPSLVYSIVRQESTFRQSTLSHANAMGLMQVTPPAGRYIAKKFNVKYDVKRLRKDPAYNVQMGAAELGDLIQDYRGSYILSFAGYNAGRGRVRDWVQRFGDPRDPRVDAVDWVERIPFSETRNYVQRVMENVQVYRAKFGDNRRLLIEADLSRGNRTN
jgi:soluble lytic murein transglycosylase